MRQTIDLAQTYAKALRIVLFESDESGTPDPPLDTCPYTLDQLLADDTVTLSATEPIAPPG